MRGSGTHPPTAALFPSPIHAKFSDLRKLRKALCERAFNSYKFKIHPHDFKKTLFKAPALQQQKGIGQAHQGDMVMPALPAASFVVVQPHFLLQLLVVLFHPPVQLGQSYQAAAREALGQVREPVLGRGFDVRWPLDQQPDRLQLGLAVGMAVSRLHPAGGQAAALRTARALAPSDGAPCLGRQRQSQSQVA